MKIKNIILTGGATAGHIWPIIAVAQELKNENVKYLYVGLKSGMEAKISANYGLPFHGIITGKIRNYFAWSNFIDPFKIIIGIIQALFIIIKLRPSTIFSKAGYVAVPILFWAKVFNIPTVIHESDSVIGKTNEWAGSFAKRICLGFPIEYYDRKEVEKFQKNLVYTGIPVRKEFFEIKTNFYSRSDRPIILITGGSQGAASINKIIKEIIVVLADKYEIFHLCGESEFSLFKKFEQKYYHVFSFYSDMPELMKKASLVITRAGSTLAEISAMSKASIIIPLPWAARDHQAANARIYQENRAAEVIPENHLTGDLLISVITRLMDNDEYRADLGRNAHKFAQADSAEKISKILIEEMK